MDLGECHNTFFDEYDTYVKTEQVSIDNATTFQHQNDTYIFLYNLISHYKDLYNQPENIKHQCNAYYTPYPPKIFLRNSVWQI